MYTTTGTKQDMDKLVQDFLDGTYHPFSTDSPPVSPSHAADSPPVSPSHATAPTHTTNSPPVASSHATNSAPVASSHATNSAPVASSHATVAPSPRPNTVQCTSKNKRARQKENNMPLPPKKSKSGESLELTPLHRMYWCYTLPVMTI